MADGQQTFDSVQDWVAHRSEERAAAAQAAGDEPDNGNEDLEAGAEDGDAEEVETGISEQPEHEEITEGADPAPEGAEDDPDAGSVDGDVDEGQEGEPETAVAAPQYLGKDEKELFEKLTPEAKKLFVEADARREAFVTKKSMELSQTRQAFEQRMEGLDGFITETQQWIDYYEGVDWERAANELDPREYQAERAKFERLKQQKSEASEKRAEAERVELQQYTREQGQVLVSMAEKDPSAKALIDPAESGKRMGELKEYLKGQGVDEATLLWASAPAVVLGYKAMLYDRAQKKASEKPLPQKRPAGKTVSPSTPAQAQTSTGKRLQQLSAKDDLSPAEFKELMRLKRNRKQ